MNIYCTGAGGTLGQSLVDLGVLPFEADVLNFDAVREEMLSKSPHVLIHLVGPKVDIDDYEKAYKLAVHGTANVIDKELYPHVRTIYISSAHVFDGKKGNYRETAKPNPINDYGLCKLAAEQVARVSGAKIIRLSSCFHRNHPDIVTWKHSVEQGFTFFPATFLRRNFAHIDHVAQGILTFANRWTDMPPLMNLAGTDDLSMYEFALAIAGHYGWDKKMVGPRKTENETNVDGYKRAKRPYKGTLNTRLARRYGIPLFSAYDGIKLL